MEKSKDEIRVAWLHNFDVTKNASSGVFMFQLFEEMKKSCKEVMIELIYIRYTNNPFNFCKTLFLLRKKCREYDIIHSQYGSGIGFISSFCFGKKILTLRGSDWYKAIENGFRNKLRILIGNYLTRISIKRYDHVIVMSERMQKEILLKFNEKDITVVPDGINLKRFFPIKKTKNKNFRVLFSTVDRHNLLKRLDLAKSGFQIFNKKYPDSEFIIMQGVLHEKVNEFVNKSDVILLTSTHEGWPNIIKEGLACNIPFISTDVSDLKFIANNTESCFICDDTPESIAEKLEILYSSKLNERLDRFVTDFDVRIVAKRLFRVYRNVI